MQEAHIEHSRWLIACAGVEDAQVTGQCKRHHGVRRAPDCTNLLVIDCSTKRIGSRRLLCLDIPCIAGISMTAEYLLGRKLTDLHSTISRGGCERLAIGTPAEAKLSTVSAC